MGCIDLVQLNNTYVDKWINEFGNASSESLEGMWSDIFSTLDEVGQRNAIRRRGISDVPKHLKKPLNVVFSSTMGTGKSTSVQHYLKYRLGTQFYKALVVVERIETCNEYEEFLEDKGAVAIHSDNGRTLENNLNAPILIITHNRLTSLLNRGLADDVFNQYDVVVIDEEVRTFQHITFNWKDLTRDIQTPLIEQGAYEGTVKYMVDGLTKLLSSCKKMETDTLGIINKYTEGRDKIMDWSPIVNELELILKNNQFNFTKDERKKLVTFKNSCAAITKNGRMKLAFLQKRGNKITFDVVIDFLPEHISKVLFDGTASINDTYKLLNKHLGADTVEIRQYHKLRSFKNATVKYYTMNTGKGGLTVDKTKVSIVDYNKRIKSVLANLELLVANTIKRYGKDEKVLFIVHKLNTEHLQKLIKGTNYSFTWWGNHVGSNEWSEYNKVIVYGLNHLPENEYTARYFSTLSSKVDTTIAGIDDFKAGLLTVDILQAIFRGSLRTVVDTQGNCSSDCEVIITLPNIDNTVNTVLNRMKCILWDANYQEISDGARPVDLDSSNTQKMEKLLQELKVQLKVSIEEKSPIEEINHTFIVVPKELSLTPQNVKSLIVNGTHTEQNIETLRANGFVYIKPSAEDKEQFELNGNVKKIFKFIGGFKDETPKLDYDENGNEF